MSKSKLYSIFKGMRRRCNNKNNASYAYYGARGISVCDRWSGPEGFKNFYEDMAPTYAKGLYLERNDVNGNYEPGNCGWATAKEQAANKRKRGRIEQFTTDEFLTDLKRRLDDPLFHAALMEIVGPQFDMSQLRGVC